MAGRRCCVSWFHRRDFQEEFGEVTPICDQLYLIDGDRITCSGGAGVADLAATLIEPRLGAAAARRSLRVLQIDRPRAARAPQPMPSLAIHVRDEGVRRAILIMEQHLAEPKSIGQIADQVGVGARQLQRRFHESMGSGPASVYRAMRLDYGRWLIAEGRHCVGQAAALSGFADSAHFAREFRKRYGFAPSALPRGSDCELEPAPTAAQ